MEGRVGVGVDIGGTWMRAVAVDGAGRVLRRARTPAPTPAGRRKALERLLSRWRIKPDVLVVGTHRVWSGAARATAARELRGLARAVHVLPDLETAWLAAFAGLPGVMVLSGTGSCAYGRDERGRACRVGGLGPFLGDEGSSFWIGKQWIPHVPYARAVRLAHDPQLIRKVAAMARTVLAKAPREAAARRIVLDAQRSLAGLAEDAARRLALRGPVRVSWHGGTFKDAAFLRGFLSALRRTGRTWAPAPARLSPEFAAALWGLRGRRSGVLLSTYCA